MTATLTHANDQRTSTRFDPFSRLLDTEMEPLGFEAGDTNLFRYVGNSPTNATDPSGLEKLKLSDLEKSLQGITQSQEAKKEAAAIAAVIRYTWELNSKWNWAAFSINNQKAKGFYCYEWAYGFQDAGKSQSSGKHFTFSVEVFGDLVSGKVHAFTTITSLETGKSIYVDDGFMGLGYVHATKPIGGIYKTPMDLIAELDKANCDVPRVITAEEYAKYWERVTAAMDATMH